MIELILLITLVVLAMISVLMQISKKSTAVIQTEKINTIELLLEQHAKSMKDEFQRNRQESDSTAKENRKELAETLKEFGQMNTDHNRQLNEVLRQQFGDFISRQETLNRQALQSVKEFGENAEKQLNAIREDNTGQLNEMRKTVDEKLQNTLEKRLGESFRQVSERLEQVHKGLGEMKNIATGVGDLKKVLSNVKTRGVLGEYQLENILEQLLTASQYIKNAITKQGTQAYVEFAIRLPGKGRNEEVLMPIDSKFPMEPYQRLFDAYEEGNKENIDQARKHLFLQLRSFAKDINTKYIDPPHTTDFAILFLPVEGLYAEVLRSPEQFDKLQREYKVTVTGPATLSALLNSLQMGFRTLAVQRRSSDVWKTLEAVKNEFDKFAGQLELVDKHLTTASKSLTDLKERRTNMMNKKLKEVATLDKTELDKTELDKTDLAKGKGLPLPEHHES